MICLSPTPVNKSDTCQLLFSSNHKRASCSWEHNEISPPDPHPKERHSSLLLEGKLESESENLALSLDSVIRRPWPYHVNLSVLQLFCMTKGNWNKANHQLPHLAYGFAVNMPWKVEVSLVGSYALLLFIAFWPCSPGPLTWSFLTSSSKRGQCHKFHVYKNKLAWRDWTGIRCWTALRVSVLSYAEPCNYSEL